MNRTATIVACVLALGLAGFTAGAPQEPGRETLVGEVIDVASFAMRDVHGEENAEAMRYRAEQGFPVGLLTEDGEVLVAVYRDPKPASGLKTANEILLDLVGKEVVCQGRVFRNSGIGVVEIAVIAEM